MGTSTHTGRMRALDGIRALSVIAVLCFHGQLLGAGYLGVDCFFVLSGFLITGLLLAERDATGAIDLRAFWLRRALRLLPALWVYLAAGLLLMAVLKPAAELRTYLTSLPVLLAGAGNWLQVGWPERLGAWSDHLWSLSVEQQFYLVWPALLIGLPALRQQAWRVPRLQRVPPVPTGAWIAGLLVLVVVWRAALMALGGSGDRAYLGTDTRADALLVGALVAVLARRGTFTRVPAAVWSPLVVAAGATLAAVAAFGPGLGEPATWLSWGGFTLVALLAAVVVAAVTTVPDGAPARLLAWGPLARLGDISYAFYLWHYPVVVILGGALAGRIGRPLAVLVSGVVSAGLAELSRRLVEDPVARHRRAILAPRSRDRGRVGHPVRVPTAGGVAGGR